MLLLRLAGWKARRHERFGGILDLYSRRLWINRFNLAVSLLTMLFGLFWLGWILLTLFEAGFKASARRFSLR